MKIRIASLKEGGNRWQEMTTAAALEIDPAVYVNPVAVAIEADKRAGRISVVVTAETEGLFVCDRCGKEFTGSVGGNCSVVYLRREQALPDEMPGDELRSFLLGQEELDIIPEVRDALLLSLPSKTLCREDCRGLCPNCGANLNDEECRCVQSMPRAAAAIQ